MKGSFLYLLWLSSILAYGQALTFQETTLVGLPTNLTNISSEWADMDGDGDLDVLVHGMNGTTGVNGIYQNDGGNSFSLHTSLPAWTNVDFAWEDYNLDGETDFVMSGIENGQAKIWLYEQESGNYNSIETALDAYDGVELQWGNINNDLYPDLVVIGLITTEGSSPSQYVSFDVYGNLGNGLFEPIAVNQGVNSSGRFAEDFELIITDYDRNGLSDVVYLSRADLQFFEQVEPNQFEWNRNIRSFGNYGNIFSSAIINNSDVPYFFFQEAIPKIDVTLTLTAPSSIAGSYYGVETSYGSTFLNNPISGDFELIEFTDYWECDLESRGSLEGKIAVVKGGCNSFLATRLKAQQEGAIAVVVINSDGDQMPNVQLETRGILIPSMYLGASDGDLLLDSFANNEVISGSIIATSETVAEKSLAYAEKEQLINESIVLDEGHYFWQLFDFLGNGLREPGYARLTDNQGKVIYEVDAGEYFKNRTRTPFAIGSCQDCFESPISLELQLDDDPEKIGWGIVKSSNYSAKLSNDLTTYDQSEIPFDGNPHEWADVDQDGSPDALVEQFDGSWNWVLNESEQWTSTTSMINIGMFHSLALTNDEKVGAIFTRNSGSTEWVLVQPSSVQTLFDPSIPDGLSIATAETSINLSWNEANEYATYEIEVIRDGQLVSTVPTTDFTSPRRSRLETAQIELTESGNYTVRVRSVGMNGRKSSYSESAQASITIPANHKIFTKIHNGLLDLSNRSEFVDIDLDGDLDVFQDGAFCYNCFDDGLLRDIKVYRNENGVLVDIELPEFEIEGAQAFWPMVLSWIDMDGDGDLDMVASGRTKFAESKTLLLTNDNWNFIATELELPAVDVGSYEWGDFDNDGDLDVFVTGFELTGGEISQTNGRLFQNYNGNFTIANDSFTPLYWESVAWVDFDGDGDLDLSRSGTLDSGLPKTELYRNDDREFVLMETGFKNLQLGSVKWADMDGDGDVDFIISGITDEVENSNLLIEGLYQDIDLHTKVYLNHVDGFVEMTHQIPGLLGSDFDFGDFDNDGDLDLLALGGRYREDFDPFGTPAYIGTSLLFENQSGTFTELITFDELYRGKISWGDMDLDGDLDILMNGSYQPEFTVGDAQLTSIYLNNSKIANTPPDPPGNLTLDVGSNYVVVTWDQSIDAETESALLTYRTELYKDGKLISAPFSNEYNNEIHDNRFKIYKNLPPGQYALTVRCMDVGRSYSEAISANFEISNIFERISGINFTNYQSSVWVDVDNNGIQDLVSTSFDLVLQSPINNIWTYAENEFTLVDSFYDSEVSNQSELIGGDFDLDGFQDLIVSGDYVNTTNGFEVNYKTTLYSNNQGYFALNSNWTSSYGEAYGSTAADLNNDGLLDLVIPNGAKYQVPPETRILLNSGSSFEYDQSIEVDVYNYSIISLDYDSDGDQDLFLGGYEELNPRIFTNTNGKFEHDPDAININEIVRYANAYDVDQDGDPDLVIHLSFPSKKIAIFENRDGVFVEKQALANDLNQFDRTFVGWGDFDNDGDPDLAASWVIGSLGSPEYITKVFKNDNGFFNESDLEVLALNGDVDWVDIDIDGDLDLIQSGNDDFENSINVLENLVGKKNTRPIVPTVLGSHYEDGELILSWEQASDNETKSEALSYNVRIWDDRGNYCWPAVLDDGTLTRNIPGNAGTLEQYKFDGSRLSDGVYKWAVQSVDNGYMGSEFSEPQEVLMCFDYLSEEVGFKTESLKNVGSYLVFDFNIPEGTVSYSIDFGDGVVFEGTNSHIYTKPGIFEVKLTLLSELGCENIKTIDLTLKESETRARITNVITPNGDGKNDYLIVADARLDLDNTLRIFNHSGKLLFETRNYLNDWNGIVGGKPLPPGQYLAVFESSGAVKVSQSFNILR